MKNPFEQLGKPQLEDPAGEEVGGVFDCQEKGCYQKVTVARYLREVRILTWKAECGHISKIENFNL